MWYYFIIHIKTNLFCSACYIYNHRVHDRIILVIYRFITIYAISVYHHKRCEFESRSGEVYSIQHYEIKLQYLCSVLRVLRFPSPIKLTATIELKNC